MESLLTKRFGSLLLASREQAICANSLLKIFEVSDFRAWPRPRPLEPCLIPTLLSFFDGELDDDDLKVNKIYFYVIASGGLYSSIYTTIYSLN